MRRLSFQWHVHRWYVALLALWLLACGGVLYLMAMRTVPSEQHLLPIGLVAEVIDITQGGDPLGLIAGFTFFLPLLVAPIGLLKFDISE